jgi:uncharacterized protein (DUF433 family)
MLEEYFSFLADDDIRIKGTRIGLEHLLYEYLYNAKSPEAIAAMFPTVSVEAVYATILYYLRNRNVMDQYVADWLDFSLKAEAEQAESSRLLLEHLRQRQETDTAA